MINITTTQVPGVVEQSTDLCHGTGRFQNCQKYSQYEYLYMTPYTSWISGKCINIYHNV